MVLLESRSARMSESDETTSLRFTDARLQAELTSKANARGIHYTVESDGALRGRDEHDNVNLLSLHDEILRARLGDDQKFMEAHPDARADFAERGVPFIEYFMDEL